MEKDPLTSRDAGQGVFFIWSAHPALCAAVSSRSGARNSIIPRSIHYRPDAGADVESDPTLSIHELRPSLPAREIHLHWPAERTLSPLATRAIEIAVDVPTDVAAPSA